MISKLPVAFVLYSLRRRRRSKRTRTRGSRRTEKVEKWLFQKESRISTQGYYANSSPKTPKQTPRDDVLEGH
jgi:hypothetical protein